MNPARRARGSANVLSSNLYDNFGTEMYASGSAATQWRFVGRFVEEEGLVAAAGGGGDMLVAREIALAAKPPPKKKKKPKPCTAEPSLTACKACCDSREEVEVGHCGRQEAICLKHARTPGEALDCRLDNALCMIAARSRDINCKLACVAHWNGTNV